MSTQWVGRENGSGEMEKEVGEEKEIRGIKKKTRAMMSSLVSVVAQL